MLKKLAILAAFFFAAPPLILLAPSAAAWDEVCVKFPLWKTWFVGNFTVVHGVAGLRDYFPNKLPIPTTGWLHRPTPDHLRSRFPDYDPEVRGIHSGHFPANQSRCVSIRELPPGEGFQVYVKTTADAVAYCPPHPVHHPKVGYVQQAGGYKKIWWEAWGGLAHPQCKYWRESN